MGDSIPLYNPNDRLTGRGGGPYLDQEEQRLAEERRAVVEGRKPDLKNPPATAGIQLSTAAQMLHTVDVNQPSSFHETGPQADKMFANAAKDKDNPLKAISEIPADTVQKPLEKGETPASANVFEPVNEDEDDDDEDDVDSFEMTLTDPPK